MMSFHNNELAGMSLRRIDLSAILRKSLDRALSLHKFIREARSSDARASITIDLLVILQRIRIERNFDAFCRIFEYA